MKKILRCSKSWRATFREYWKSVRFLTRLFALKYRQLNKHIASIIVCLKHIGHTMCQKCFPLSMWKTYGHNLSKSLFKWFFKGKKQTNTNWHRATPKYMLPFIWLYFHQSEKSPVKGSNVNFSCTIPINMIENSKPLITLNSNTGTQVKKYTSRLLLENDALHGNQCFSLQKKKKYMDVMTGQGISLFSWHYIMCQENKPFKHLYEMHKWSKVFCIEHLGDCIGE